MKQTANASLTEGRRRRGNGWRKETEANIKASGRFWQKLVAQVLHGEVAGMGDDYDVLLPESGTGIEVKSASSKDGVKVRETQLDNHLATSNFPCNHYWYACARYSNFGPGIKGQGRLFQNMVRGESDLPLFFTSQPAELYFVDISVIDAVRKKNGAKHWQWSGSFPSMAVYIGWPFFRQLKADTRGALRGLGLAPNGYKSVAHPIRVQLEQHEFELDTFALVRSKAAGLARVPLRMLNVA